MIEQRVVTDDGYTVHNTTNKSIVHVDLDILDLIVEQNNTIIRQNTELINYLRTLRKLWSRNYKYLKVQYTYTPCVE